MNLKILAFILSLLVLTLNCIPCADGISISKADGTQSEIIKNQQQQQEDHEDACSPFCHCACCAGFTINHSIALIPVIKIFSNNKANSFLPSTVVEIALPIWQPPQLV